MHLPSLLRMYPGLAYLAGAGALAYLAPKAYRLAAAMLTSRGGRTGTPVGAASDSTPATGVLASAVANGQAFTPDFVSVTLDDGTVISVGADMLKLDGLRMPVSWPDTIAIGKKFGWVAPSKKIADAIYAAAPTKTSFHSLVTSDPTSGGEKMHTYEDVRKYNADVEGQLATARAAGTYAAGAGLSALQSGAEKYWLLSPRLAETVKATGAAAAVNYGAWDANGKPLQSPGAVHDVNYVGDYSQLIRPITRYARDAGGNKIDLLDWMVSNDNVPRAFADLFKA